MTHIPLRRSPPPALPPGFETPAYDLAQVTPGIVHVGLGGFHRAHMARYTHDLMGIDRHALGWGIQGAGLRPDDAPLLEALGAQECLYTLVEREGDVEKRALIGSIVAAIDASTTTAALLAAIDDPRTRIVSATVTENGYHLDRATRRLDFASPAIAADLASPTAPRTLPGLLVEAFRRRRAGGQAAFTALSCDNIQHNGNVLKAAVVALAARQDAALADWIEAEASFPNTMVDRITPVPTAEEIAAFSATTGLDDHAVLHAELFSQWVIEDRFVASRPAWEKVGAQFVEDVTPYEFMKLRLLNGSHLAIAALGQLAGYETIGGTIADPLLRRYMIALMDRETGPTLMPVPGIDLAEYKRTLIARFANPAIRDTTQRVNSDAPVNVLLDPLRDRVAAGEPFDLLALGLAAWLRRARGEGEDGRPVTVTHPMAELLAEKAREGGRDAAPLLSITPLFGALGQNPGVVATVGDWLASLYDLGTRATMAEAAERGLF
ncbi:mannitol dehydrogenase family protein [Sphingomonas sp.]|uniref:mannitol dehydrogenase family protein n=1 Tax=Sphingomonas sp. TaxID=28214 RepID=UPI002DD628CA|nr:mannitol dehydrogenase family protein [Sphingomonas sp.]